MPSDIPLFKVFEAEPVAYTVKKKSKPSDILNDIENHPLLDYAMENFQQQQIGGVLSKKKVVNMESLLQFSKKLNSSLHKLSEQDKEAAIGVFNQILCFMGDVYDSKQKPGSSNLAQSILQVPLANSDLRDEVYCQLCKQVMNHPRQENMERGWELLSFCTETFAPSQKL